MRNSAHPIAPLVSVIIPVYNSARTVAAAIGSVTGQTYSSLEIIVVNDGSTDESQTVIQELAARDKRIICLDRPNAGTNLARKAGLDRAAGEYVQYLDADDVLFPDAIERLVCRAEQTQADIVSAPFVVCFEDGRQELSPVLSVAELSGRDYFRRIFDWSGATWNMWGNFQRRSLVYDYAIEILSDVPYGQDATWMIQLFFHNPRIVALHEPILSYNRNPHSVSYSRAMSDRRYRGSRRLCGWFTEFLQQRGLSEEFGREQAILQMNMTFTCIHALRFCKVWGDMRTLIRNADTYPELPDRLSGVDREIFDAFRKSYFRGWRKLLRYRRKGRL